MSDSEEGGKGLYPYLYRHRIDGGFAASDRLRTTFMPSFENRNGWGECTIVWWSDD